LGKNGVRQKAWKITEGFGVSVKEPLLYRLTKSARTVTRGFYLEKRVYIGFTSNG